MCSRVQASNRDDAGNPNSLRVPIRVLAPWWRQPLALLAYALLAAIVLLFAWTRWKRQRQRRTASIYRELHEREERLKLALWASGEQFWDATTWNAAMLRRNPDEHSDRTPLEIASTANTRSIGRPAAVLDHLREHLRGQTPLFSPNTACAPPGLDWVRVTRIGSSAMPTARACRIAGTARNITCLRQVDRERQIAASATQA